MRFLRYPGGKTKLLTLLAMSIPSSSDIQGRYIEPFVGGGSVFLHVQPPEAIISDLNKELVDLYRGIRNYPHKVWSTFEAFPSGRKAYYIIRDDEIEGKPLYYRAARTLYLNRTCFKGMWRHGRNGNFSVGYGGEERRRVVTHDGLVELAKRLRRARILRSDFEDVLDQCREGDFVFLDPPYKPGEKELLENHYTHGQFSYDDQARLARKVRKMTANHGVSWLMTNSSHEDICALYEGFSIARIPRGASGVIGVQTDDAKEVLISNYGCWGE